MDTVVQYLVGSSRAARVFPVEARACLRAAFERVPFAMVLLRWHLDSREGPLLSTDQFGKDFEAVLAGAPDGVVLSWDLWHMPLDRLDLVNLLYLRPTTR